MRYLQAIQEADGHWPQNCWLDGTPYWNGVQMDECAFPSCSPTSRGAKPPCRSRAARLWPMVKRAAAFIA
jgi:glucoamylase